MFGVRLTGRRMRVLLDGGWESARWGTDDAGRQLQEMFAAEDIEVWVVRGEALTPDSPTWGPSFPLDVRELRVRELSDRDFASHELEWTDGDGWTRSAIFGNLIEVAGLDETAVSYSPLVPSERAARRCADAVVAGVAESLGVDLLISRRDYLHRGKPHLVRDVTVCTPESAVGLTGLFLRTRDRYECLGIYGAVFISRWTGGFSFWSRPTLSFQRLRGCSHALALPPRLRSWPLRTCQR